MKRRKLVISRRAREEYKDIGRYTEAVWGKTQRDSYLRSLKDEFERIRSRPERGRPFTGGSQPLLFVRAKQHYVYYDSSDAEVVIYAILHTRMDPSLHL